MSVRSGRSRVALVVVLLVAIGCTRSGSPTPTVSQSLAASPSPAGEEVDLELVTGGLDSPLFVTGAGDGSGRLFVVEQGGAIRIVKDGRLLAEPFLDISARIQSGGERGLLGLAFPPGFGSTWDEFWVHYSDENGDTVISSFKVSDNDPDRADPQSEVKFFTTDQPYANHNGGWIGFGPDKMLYIALGDGGSGGDPQGNGQRLDTYLGKLLRIDVLAPSPGGGRVYMVPTDNPFAGDIEGRGEIWSFGLRNPWRVSFDRATGDLWIGDVGQNAWEEVDRSLAAEGAGRGLNFGWNVTEGRHCFKPADGCDTDGITMPIAEYSHPTGGCTVIGGYVYRGAAYPNLTGTYVFADICSGLIWGLASGGPAEQDPVILLRSQRQISSFGEDDAGELYLTDLGGGEIYRVVGRPSG